MLNLIITFIGVYQSTFLHVKLCKDENWPHYFCFSSHIFKLVLYTSVILLCRSLHRDITFVEFAFSAVQMYILYRWERGFFRHFLLRSAKQGKVLMWCFLWIARVATNVLTDVILGISRKYLVAIVLDLSASLTLTLRSVAPFSLSRKSWFVGRIVSRKFIYVWPSNARILAVRLSFGC